VSARRPRRSERGAVAVLVLLAMAMFIAFVGAAVNLGHLYSVRGEIQNAGDAGALAGARVLDGSATGLANAPVVAQSTGALNPTDTSTVNVQLGDVTTGHWDVATRTFTATSNPAQAAQINAVRVNTFRDASHGSAVAQLFSSFLGNRATSDVAATATAVGGGPSSVPCVQMPMVVSKCDLPNLVCDQSFRVTWTNDWSDSTGWASFPPLTYVSAATVKNDIATALNPGSCTEVSNGDVANMLNGDATSACKTLLGVWSQDPNHDWIIPVVDAGCPTRYVQTAPVVDFIYFRITAVVCSGSPKYIDVKLLCNHAPPPGAKPGGDFNQSITPVPPALVQ
jgi:Flp pilus assembly protein TadG